MTDKTIIDIELPEQEIERICLLEEMVMTQRATDIIRKSNHLIRLHNLRTGHGPEGDLNHRKPVRQILLSIDPDQLHQELHWKLEQERIYLNEDLTISCLAHELGIEPHQLSRFLNIHLGTTFTDMINAFRVREAKELLSNDPESTILDIAFSSGFNSKASFNRVFKKVMGMTPSEYRMKTHIEGDSLR